MKSLKQFFFQKHYETFDEAFHDAKRSKILGFIVFSENFTDALPIFNDVAAEEDFTDDGLVQVYLDNSNSYAMTLIKKTLYDTYQLFIKGIMADCRKSEAAGSLPIAFETLFGEINFDMRVTMNAGFALS